MKLRTCRTCGYYYESSVFSTVPIFRRLCVIQARFKKPDDTCPKWSVTDKYILCPELNKVVEVRLCREATLEACKTCPYRQLLLETKKENLLHRNNRKPFEPHYQEVVTMELDGRDKIYRAWQMLVNAGLAQIQLNIEPILTAKGKELKELVEQFLDAVELVPLSLEDKIPEFVINVYNDIVDGKLYFVDEKVGDVRVIVEEDDYKFRRRRLE